jgi:hypothetical protein
VKQESGGRIFGIPFRMSEPRTTKDYRVYPKGPNFLLIVALAGVVLILLFIGAYFLVGGHGAKMLPHAHRRDAEPTSQVVMPLRATSPAAMRANV